MKPNAGSRRISGPARLSIAWACLILLGAAILRLPTAARGESLSWLNALFTSTSAVCVTGLSTVDVGEHLSGFGQTVLLVLMQLGGLGISVVSTLLFAAAGKATLSRQYDVQDALAAVRFGQCMLESLVKRRFDTLVIDQREEKVQWARDIATKAVRADALNFDVFRELLPEKLHFAIVDLGDRMERSILVTNYLHKLQVQNIVVEAVNAEHAEILQIVGATRIVYPEREAAERLAGLLAGRGTLDYFPVSEAFSLIEVPVPPAWVSRTLLELDLRKNARVLVVAARKRHEPDGDEHWRFLNPEQAIAADDIVLLAGSPKDIERSVG